MSKLLMKRITLKEAMELLQQPNHYLHVTTSGKYDTPSVRIYTNKKGDIASISNGDYLKLKPYIKLNSIFTNHELYEWQR